MLFRRVLTHIRSQNWLAVAIDFLIVVTGVAMGLQAQEWNQQRKERLQEKAYLGQLLSDFTSIENEVKRCLAVHRDSIKAIEYVLQVMDAGAARGAAQEKGSDMFSKALVSLTASWMPAGRSATFVEMISSGKLHVLRDGKLRNALIAYDQRAQRDRELWRTIRSETGEYYSVLYENVDLSIDLDQSNYASVRGYDFEALFDNTRFRTMLNVAAGVKANTYVLCKQQLALTERARRLIGKNRNPASR